MEHLFGIKESNAISKEKITEEKNIVKTPLADVKLGKFL